MIKQEGAKQNEDQNDVNKKSSLQGIIWDLLRLQLKVAATGGAAAYLLFLVLQSLVFPNRADSSLIDGGAGALESDFVLFGVLTLAFMLIFLVTGWIYSYAYGVSLKKTIAHFIHQLKQFRRGSLNRKIIVQRKDEFHKLADEVNELTADLEQQIVSMRRVLNENAGLIAEAEKGASLEERRKLARDLHDAVSQELFAVSMSLGAVPKVLHSDAGKAETLFKQIEKMVHHAQQELRALIMHLRPVTLEGKTLKQAMESLISEFRKKHPNLEFHCQLKHLPLMEKGIEEQLFRVLQEGLSNALRHANPKVVNLSALLRRSSLLIVLEDDGDGFDLENIHHEKTGNYGLTSMNERMVELGGHLSIVSYPKKGTKLEFRVPLTTETIIEESEASGGKN